MSRNYLTPAAIWMTPNVQDGNLRKARLAVNLACFGGLGLVIGFAWNSLFPINKNLWSSSYVAVTGGMTVASLAAVFYIVDFRMRIRWTKPFVILGLNAITVYVLSEIGNLALIYTTVPLVSGSIALKSLIFERLFASWAGPLHGSFLYALAYLAFCWAIAAILYKKRVFLKV